MTQKPPRRERGDLLRHLAEERLRRTASPNPARLSPAQIQELFHELQVHQIELEMQNEELQRTSWEAQEARDRYRTLYESAPVGYLTLGPDGEVQDANRAVSDILGVSRSALVGRSFSNFVAPRSQDAWHLLRRRLARSGRHESCELCLELTDGEIRYVEAVGLSGPQAEGSGEGAPAAIRLALVDVTARRATEQALRDAASQAALAEHRERRQLAVDLHDDLGQTLNLASMKLKRFADSSEEENERSLQEISRLLEEARGRVSSLSFQLSPPVLYDVGLVAAAEWLAEDLEHRYGLIVTIAQGDEPEADEATLVTLYRALRELLINVAKHSGVREAHVRIWQEGRSACLEVTDGGRGFDPREVQKGFGLLALRERVAHLGGTVTISSPGQSGAQIRICVPARGPAEPPAEGSKA